MRVGNYVNSLKKVFASNPNTQYEHGLNTWWPVSGADIRKDFIRSIHARINDKANEGWRNGDTISETEERRDAKALHDWLQHRIICRRLTSKRLQKRFGHLLFEG